MAETNTNLIVYSFLAKSIVSLQKYDFYKLAIACFYYISYE